MRHIDVFRITALVVGAGLAATARTDTSTQTSTVTATPTTGVSNGPSGGTRKAQKPLTGTWSGTWQRTSQPPGEGTYTLKVTQLGSTITGTIVAQGSACLTKHQLTGTISGDRVTLHVADKGVTADYIGKVSGMSMSGTATVSCTVGIGTATWKVTKQ
jgi:hypothetical protein